MCFIASQAYIFGKRKDTATFLEAQTYTLYLNYLDW